MSLRMTLILGGAVLALASVSIVACGSGGSGGNDGGTGGTKGSATGGSSGTGAGGSAGAGGTAGAGGLAGSATGGTTGSGAGGTTGTSMDAGIDCGKQNKVYAEKPDGGMYCPFSGVDGGPTQYCKTPSQVCCVPPCPASGPCTPPPSVCETAGTACPVTGSVTYECEGPLDCMGNKAGGVCCASGVLETNGPECLIDAGYAYVGMASGLGTTCAKTCPAGQTVVCALPTDCPTGKSCVPADLHGNHVGYCQ